MAPSPSHSGGSMSAKAGAGVAACISVLGTSVRTWASLMAALIAVPVFGVWQIAMSGPISGIVAFELDAEPSKPRWPLMLDDVSRIEPPISATYVPGRDNRAAIECVMVASKLHEMECAARP